MTTAQAPTTNPVADFLKIAPTVPFTIVGSVASGASGGSTSNVVFQDSIPVQASFITAIEYWIQMEVALTLPATTGAATLSPFAPYCAFSQQLGIGGTSPWPMIELLPFYLDSIKNAINYDPIYPGLGNGSGYFGSITDQGPWANVVGGAGSLNPGATVTNTTASPTTTNYTFNFKVRQQLQRRRHLLWGAVPVGDVANRITNRMQLNPLVGINPENCLFVSSAGATATLAQAATVTAVYELKYIDLAYPGVNPPNPSPSVNMGLQIVRNSKSGFSMGAVSHQLHDTAMLYTDLHHVAVNAMLPIQLDYFGLWDTEAEQNARVAYDAQQNTFGQYFVDYHRRYHRYPLKGEYKFDLETGDFPPITTVTPYVGWMTNAQPYDQLFGIPLTPAMSTAWRFPSATTASNPYVVMYDFGLKEVPY